MTWDEPNAHSKWAVSATKPIFCIGDINRMTTQFERGGGAACLNSEALADQFRTAAFVTDSCPPAL
jgi:deoxyribonuclease-2